MNGSGGIGAVSVGLSELLIYFLLFAFILAVAFGIWKLVKLLWAAFAG
jgi:hypothetical protein